MDNRFTKPLFFSITFLSTLFLTGCGGGGGGGGGATPSPTIYSVTTLAGTGGSISPSNRSLTAGQSTTFTLTANSGYRIASATGCNGTLAGSLYTIGNVSADCVVSASFVTESTYSISTTKSAGGNISPSAASVKEGNTISFTITPDTGYRIARATGCNGTLEGNNFTTAVMASDCVLDVSFEPQRFTINTEVIGPGGLNPSSVTLNYGQEAIFYQTKLVLGHNSELSSNCNAIWDATGGIKVPAITENCTLRLKYIPFKYEITAVAEGDGSISPSKVFAYYGDELRFKVQPGTANRFSYGKGCDGYFDSKESVFIIPFVNGDCQLQASFHDTRYVYFADPNLEQKVRKALAIASEQPILPSDMEKLQDVNGSNSQIKQLDGLEYAKNLKSLYMGGNQITNLRPLANLALEWLSIPSNPINDQQLQFLSHSQLHHLALDNTDITDLASVASQTKLSYLSIQFTQVTDLTPLKQLENLKTLAATSTSVTDISPLLSTGLRNLTSVGLGGCLVNQGFSRALTVVDALKAKGISVELEKPGSWPQQKCPNNTAIQNVSLNGTLDNGDLLLNWQVVSTDTGPWRCELHFNLDSQLPRLPAKVIDNCHMQTSIRLPGFNLNEYTPSLRVDTGLYNGRMTSAPANITSPQKPQTPSLHSYDWAQTLLKTNPLLVPGKEATLRLHVTAQTPGPVPSVEVYGTLAGRREAVPVTPPAAIPTSKHHGERNQSFFTQIPARLMQPELMLEVFLDGKKQLALTPTFSKVKGIHLTLIPLQAGERISTLPDDTVVRNSLTRFWPLGEIQITRRAPYQLSKPTEKNTVSSMLSELADLRAVENGTDYYYGYFDRGIRTGLKLDGLGYQPGMVAVGINDLLTTEGIDGVLAHELGHNFDRPHAPCNNSESDPEYPYSFGAIGSYGADQNYTKIINPDAKDLMGYCGFEHVSDHNYEKAQDYLEQQVGKPSIIRIGNATRQKPGVESRQHQSSLYMRVFVDNTGSTITQQIALPHLPALMASDSHKVVVQFVDGSEQTLPVAVLHLGHGGTAGEYQLQLAIPTDKQPIHFSLQEGDKSLLEHDFINAPAEPKEAVTQLSIGALTKTTPAKTDSTAAEHHFIYRNNEICVEPGATKRRHVNLLWHHSEGVVALAINETAATFCRSLNNIPAGKPELQAF